MYSHRGRGGPRQPTPANVQCQKCLKRDEFTTTQALKMNPLLTFEARHYSYECKESAQSRPYVSRPSRTQQLRNPKLMPKLTNDTPDDAQRKKGIADEELAKKEAERVRMRELEERDDELIRQTESKRRRSVSVDSVSTISTSRSTTPPPRRRSRSPAPARRRQLSPEERKGSRRRSPSVGSADNHSVSRRSEEGRRPQSPPRRRQRSPSRDSRSPRGSYEKRYREREADRTRPSTTHTRDRRNPRESSYSRESSLSRGGDVASGSRSLSRSPEREDVRSQNDMGRGTERERGSRREQESRFDRGAKDLKQERRPAAQEQPQRERSLSPFSKRLAMTQAMNMGR